MTDERFNNMVAQFAHALAGYSVLLTFVFLHVPYGFLLAIGLVTAYAAVKEFWYDYRYEDAVTRGSSLEDFVFYIVGLAIAAVVTLL
jgi:hypothetical protein